MSKSRTLFSVNNHDNRATQLQFDLKKLKKKSLFLDLCLYTVWINEWFDRIKGQLLISMENCDI